MVAKIKKFFILFVITCITLYDCYSVFKDWKEFYSDIVKVENILSENNIKTDFNTINTMCENNLNKVDVDSDYKSDINKSSQNKVKNSLARLKI